MDVTFFMVFQGLLSPGRFQKKNEPFSEEKKNAEVFFLKRFGVFLEMFRCFPGNACCFPAYFGMFPVSGGGKQDPSQKASERGMVF